MSCGQTQCAFVTASLDCVFAAAKAKACSYHASTDTKRRIKTPEILLAN